MELEIPRVGGDTLTVPFICSKGTFTVSSFILLRRLGESARCRLTCRHVRQAVRPKDEEKKLKSIKKTSYFFFVTLKKKKQAQLF